MEKITAGPASWTLAAVNTFAFWIVPPSPIEKEAPATLLIGLVPIIICPARSIHATDFNRLEASSPFFEYSLTTTKPNFVTLKQKIRIADFVVSGSELRSARTITLFKWKVGAN